MTLSRALTGIGLVLAMGGLGLALDGCNQQSVTRQLRSLQASGEVTFVCRDISSGLTIDHCPDVDNDPPTTVLDALVTQTATNEIAIIDVNHALVVDVDPSAPGYNFLRLPSRPGDIVTTPGGTASFVGLTSSGKTGISAIPTECVGPPRSASLAQGIPQAERDVTTFPACTLPSAPGDIAVVVEPPAPDGTIAASCADPETPETSSDGGRRFTVVDAASESECTAYRDPVSGLAGVWYLNEASDPPAYECRSPNGRDCVADLTQEGGPPGRRKLVVALPDEGRLVVLDAQAVLDRSPGSFDPCTIEREIPLESAPDASGQTQSVPPDLAPPPGCNLTSPTPPPLAPSAPSRPAGFGVTDGRLYVGDLGVPLVHVLDTSSVCKLNELPPLLPMSYLHPERTVTTSRVAVTPLSPSGKQYVYAVDVTDQPTSSVMIFDVSHGVSDRTPIIRPGSDRQPREAADRLQYPAPVADVTFALRDLPNADPATGVAELGVECDPDPLLPLDPAPPEVQYRTSADKTEGARPRLLRGLFGLVLLTNGQMYVVDVDDFDEKCRRPRTTNASSVEDFRGCANDPADISYYTYVRDANNQPELGGPGDTATVSDEVSCNMVEPHRTRSEAFGIADATLGIAAPSLRALPRFEVPVYAKTPVTADRPKLLAVPFTAPEGGEGVPPQVYVGTTLYNTTSEASLIPTAPAIDEDTSAITLPQTEPRSYLTNDHNTLTFEGRVVGGDFPSGFFDLSALSADSPGRVDDTAAFYCGQDVYDEAAMADYASQVLGLSKDASAAFATTHADYVQITGDFPSLIDPYWQSARGLAGGGRDACRIDFGPPPGQGQDLQSSRDFEIVEAYQDHLMIRPRPTPPADQTVEEYFAHVKESVAYCFPSGVRYTVRASNQWIVSNSQPSWLHDTVVDYAHGNRCVRDCDPRKRWFKNRVFEIATTDVCGPSPSAEACLASGVGPGTDADGPCRYDPVVNVKTGGSGDTGAGGAGDEQTSVEVRGVGLNEPGGADKCIFENLSSRFAIYRGQQPSVRDMSFVWDQTGGFYPLVGSLTTQSSVVLPQHIAYVSVYQSIAIVDAASLGLSMMGLDTLTIVDPWPVF